MVKFINRCKVQVASGGTGTLTFGSAVASFESLADQSVVNADQLRYTLEQGNEYEVGTGVIGLAGSTYTMTRTPLKSSNSDNSAINAGASAVCFFTMLADDVTQYLADLANVSDTSPSGGQTLTWDAAASTWKPASPSGGIVNVSTYANLPGSPSVTDLAFVTDTKSLYIYDGLEWDRFYTDTNATPDWTTEPPETDTLAADGTAKVQTVAASDPEGFPIEYSHDTNPSDQAQATISNVAGVFTITPSTTEANEGSFTLRYRATDGIHSTSRSTVYTLSFYTNPDIANASYDSKSFALSQSAPHSIWMNPTGTKLYAYGYSSDRVYQYSLSTANDISTASYDNVNFNVSSQEGSGRAMCFSGDGLHFYIGGSSTDSIFQYDMTTAFDVSTASYSNYSLSVSSQETTPASLGFNTTGTKMFVMGYSSDKVHSYDLSSAYDLSTASYNNVNFSVSSQETTPYGFAFNKTGSKMYVVGTGTDKIYEYDLSTEFDLSTCSYNNVCSGALSSSTNPVSIYFSADARKMFIQTTADAVYQYST